MRERLVGLRHLVRVFSLLYSGAAVAGGVEELAGELLGHAALAPTAGGADDPPHRQRGAPVGTHFDPHLIRRPAARPPRIMTIECSWRLWPTPGIYDVTSSPFVSLTRATLRSAEFGFLGVVV